MVETQADMSAVVRDALESGAGTEEIAEALGISEDEVAALAATATAEQAISDGTATAAEVVRQQITRAENAVAAAEAAGDTTGARVWAGIVARLVPLLVRAEQDRDNGLLGLTAADLKAAEAYVRELADRAIAHGGKK